MTIRETVIAALTGISLLASPVGAGGPVLIEDAYEAEAPAKLSPGQKAAIAAGIIIAGILIGGNGGGSDACNGDPEPTPEPGC